MSLDVTLEALEQFTFSLLKHSHQGKATFNYLLSSQTLLMNASVKEMLQLHSAFRFGESYALIMKLSNSSTYAFYSKLSSYLLSLEELAVRSIVQALTVDYSTLVKSQIDFNQAPHRKVLLDFYNINKDDIASSHCLKEEMLYVSIINLLEYYEFIKERKELSPCLNDFLLSASKQLGSSLEEKNARSFISNMKAFFEANQLTIQSPCDTQSEMKSQRSNEIRPKHGMNKEKEDKAFDDKLNYIYESLKDITFDSNSFSRLNGIPSTADLQIEESKSNECNYLFLQKLKIFSMLKKNAAKRKANKSYYLKKEQMKGIAKYFYWNLLKSRTFFGFAKIMKQRAYFNIIKNNYIDYRIAELSRKLLQILVYSSNRSKLAHCAEKRHSKCLKKKVIGFLKEKAHYKRSFNQFYTSRIINNQFALKFMLVICSKAKNRMSSKPTFKAIHWKMQKTDELNENRRLFNMVISALKLNKKFNERLFMKCKERFVVIDYTCFVNKVRQLIHAKRRQRHFLQKLFFMRYYMKYYQHQHDKKKMKEKHSQVILITLKLNYLRFKHRVLAQASHKGRLNAIMSSIGTTQLQEQGKANSALPENKTVSLKEGEIKGEKPVRVTIEKERSNRDKLYCFHLKQGLWGILKRYHFLQQKTFQFREISTKRAIGVFFKLMKIKVIKDLIQQGIIEKIKQYQYIYMLQLLFSAYFARLKYSKGKAIRTRYLRKTALKLLSRNVVLNYKLIQLKMRYFFRLFNKKARFISSNKAEDLQTSQSLMRAMQHRIFLKAIKLKLNADKNRKELVRALLTKSQMKGIKRFLFCKRKRASLLNNDQMKRRVYAKLFLRNLKKRIELRTKRCEMKAYQSKKLLSAFNKRVHDSLASNTLNLLENRLIIQRGFEQFRRGINSKGAMQSTSQKLKLIAQEFYSESFVNAIILSIRLKSISNSVYQIFQNKIKEKIFQVYKRQYLNKIKTSMLTYRYREYLIITCLSKLLKH